MDDRLMTVKQLAMYLNVNERTVLKLVTDGRLPGLKIGNQWRFRKTMIDTWIDDQMLGVMPCYVNAPFKGGSKSRMLELSHCFHIDHIIPELLGSTKVLVVEELAGLATRLGLVMEKSWFTQALMERENIMPTAIGNQVAFLHTVRRNPTQVIRPFMLLGRSLVGVDFDSLDGQPTHLFFVLGLKYDELHLPWLAKLSQMLARAEAVRALLEAPDSCAIFEELSKTEQMLSSIAI